MSNIDRFFDILLNKGGINVVLDGLKNTMMIAVCGLIIGVVIGTLIATIRVLPKYNIFPRILDGLCTVYVGIFRGTPMVVQLLVFYYVLLPLMRINMPSVTVALLVFGFNSGAYVSEIMRAGILSVDPGQMEGARSLGLSYSAAMMKIVIPQAIKNILPTLGNEFITLVKETSVVSFIGALDLYRAFSNIGNATYEYMVPYLSMAIVYIVIICIITILVKAMERRLRKSDR